MHYVLAILAAIGVIAGLLWRLHLASEAAKGMVETVGDARKFWRRHNWRRKLSTDNPAALIDDPREAAAAMMAAVADADGALSERERETILEHSIRTFGLSPPEAEELLAGGRWLARSAGDLSSFLRKLVPIIEKGCDDGERRELMSMLDAVAAADGAPPEFVADAIARLRQRLLAA
jgi:uncharacterized tellurite resistance protein B-like protein